MNLRLGLLAIAVLVAAVCVATYHQRMTRLSAYVQSQPLVAPEWPLSDELLLRPSRDGGWLLFAMTWSSIDQLFGPDFNSDGARVSPEPSPAAISATHFFPAVRLSPNGTASLEADSRAAWADSTPPDAKHADRRYMTARFFQSYTQPGVSGSRSVPLDRNAIPDIFPIDGDYCLDVAESPHQNVVAIVSHSLRLQSAVVQFFDTESRRQIGRSVRLMNSNPDSSSGYDRMRGWTPDGRWLIMTSYVSPVTQPCGLEPFGWIWAVAQPATRTP